VDSFTDPLGVPEGELGFDERATETLVRLDPCFLCYRPPPDAPLPFRDPAFPGPIFGSFNATKKINRSVIALWARVLEATPGSRLLLKAFDLRDPAVPERITGRFADRGIDASRLIFLPATKGLAEHLAVYSRVDVGLDPLPYNGTTTTCEALWMGVPVVTLAGRTHAGRVGVSLLNNVGAPELVTQSEDEYVAAASRLAQDGARLAQYRATLRGMMAASPLCDAPGFAARLGDALRRMWSAHCDGAEGVRNEKRTG